MLNHARQFLLYGAAILTLLAAYFAPPAEEPIQPAHVGLKAQNHLATIQGDQPILAGHLSQPLMPKKRSRLADEPGNLFQVEAPPPKAAALASKAPAPVAPPMPYVYMGKMIEGGELTVFLTRQNQPYTIHTGDILDGQYRVDAIRPPLVEFTYLPLKQKQVLNIGVSK